MADYDYLDSERERQDSEQESSPSSLDLERLFQEAEQTIDQIIQHKKELVPGQMEPGPAEPGQAEPLSELQAENERLTAEVDMLLQKYNQLEFEFQNYIGRVQREATQSDLKSKAEVLSELVEVLDVFDFAKKTFNSEKFPHTVESYQKGFNLLHKQFFDLLAGMGLAKVHSVGEAFDPNLHQAVAAEESADVDVQTVIHEIKSGYLYHDTLLRPAMVKVAIPTKKD